MNAQCVSPLAPVFPLTVNNICGDVVNYFYFVPSGRTSANLSAIIRDKFDTTKGLGKFFKFLPNACQVNLKKLVCGQVYKRCYLDGSMRAPCPSMCTTVADKCFRYVNVFEDPQYVGKKMSLTRFSALAGVNLIFLNNCSTNLNSCNPLDASITVGQSKQKYLYASPGSGGACTGIIRELYVPTADLLSMSLSLIQPQFATQTAIETQLRSNFAALPAWLSPNCHWALRQFFCTNYMLGAEAVRLGSVLSMYGYAFNGTTTGLCRCNYYNSTELGWGMDYELYAPKYPHNNICQNFWNQCGAFMAQTSLKSTNCSAASAGVSLYPTKVQAVGGVKVAALGATVSLYTSPALLSGLSNDSSYYTKCPWGFVVPDDPFSLDNVYVPGSGCTKACRVSPINPYALRQQDIEIFVLSIIETAISGFLLLAAVIDSILHVVPAERRKKFSKTKGFVLSLLMMSFLCAVSYVVLFSVKGDKKFCRNNANGISYKDGVTRCSFQALALLYTLIGGAVGWLIQGIDLFSLVVLQITDPKYKLHTYQYPLIFGLPFIPMITAIVQKQYGYSNGSSFCLFTSFKTHNHALVMLVFTYIICLGSALACIISVGWCAYLTVKISHLRRATYPDRDVPFASVEDKVSGLSAVNVLQIQPQSNSKDAPPAPPLLVLRQVAISNRATLSRLLAPLVFIAILLFVWLSFFVTLIRDLRNGVKGDNHNDDWAACMFKNYKPTEDDHVQAVCGRPYRNVPDSYYYYFNLTFTVQSLSLVLVNYKPLWHMLVRLSKRLRGTFKDVDDEEDAEYSVYGQDLSVFVLSQPTRDSMQA